MTTFRQWQKIRQSGTLHKVTRDELEITKIAGPKTPKVDAPVGRADNDNDKAYE